MFIIEDKPYHDKEYIKNTMWRVYAIVSSDLNEIKDSRLRNKIWTGSKKAYNELRALNDILEAKKGVQQ